MTLPISTLFTTAGNIYSVVVGADSNIWGSSGAGWVRFTPAGGSVTSIGYGGSFGQLYQSVLAGSQLWTFSATGELLGVTTSGAVTDAGNFPNGVSQFLASDGTDWYLRYRTPAGTNYFSKMSGSTGSGIIGYVVAASDMSTSGILGPDGRIWSSNGGTDAEAETTSGTLSSYTAFLSGSTVSGGGIGVNAICSDGTYLWYADYTTGYGVWRVTTSGSSSQVTITGARCQSVAFGSDGNIYALSQDSTGSGTLYQIDPSTLSVTGSVTCPTIPTGSSYWQSLYSDGTYLWMCSQTSVVCRWSFGLPPTAQLVMPL